MQIFNVNIEGYWREKHKAGIPDHSGVYFVYEAMYDPEKDIIRLIRLIYIHSSENVKANVAVKENHESWMHYLNLGNELCYSTGYVEGVNRTKVEAAYIFKHKPLANKEHIDSFPFDQTTIISIGKTALLDTNFTVQRS
ncbi:hypothetical protein MASR2M41_02930 [Flammeovirgaceae bacterium]